MKAEVFSIDFVVGLAIFLLGIIIFESFYVNLDSEINNYKIRDDLQSKANGIADNLITGSGYPKNWNSTNVEVIGFYDSGLISLYKFDQLKNIEYYTAKRMMGVGGYEIYLEITNQTGGVLSGYTYGMKELPYADQVFYVKRLGLVNYNGNITKAILNVGVWA